MRSSHKKLKTEHPVFVNQERFLWQRPYASFNQLCIKSIVRAALFISARDHVEPKVSSCVSSSYLVHLIWAWCAKSLHTKQVPVVQKLDTAIQRIGILETNWLIHWIEINPSDSAIHLLNNWGLINCNVDVRTESHPRPSSDEEGQEGICFEQRNISTISQSPFHTPSQTTTN